MNARLQLLIDEAKQRWDAARHDGKVHITVAIDTSSIARGAEVTLAALRAAAANRALNLEVGVSGSWGFNWLEPTLTVRSAGGTRTVLYANVTADRVPEFIDRKSVV